jgi:hypothetical protein
MEVWCFVGFDGLWGLSSQRSGENLPEEHGPWKFLKTANLTGSCEDELAAQASIEQFGFCCFRDGADG